MSSLEGSPAYPSYREGLPAAIRKLEDQEDIA